MADPPGEPPKPTPPPDPEPPYIPHVPVPPDWLQGMQKKPKGPKPLPQPLPTDPKDIPWIENPGDAARKFAQLTAGLAFLGAVGAGIAYLATLPVSATATVVVTVGVGLMAVDTAQAATPNDPTSAEPPVIMQFPDPAPPAPAPAPANKQDNDDNSDDDNDDNYKPPDEDDDGGGDDEEPHDQPPDDGGMPHDGGHTAP